jgi:hypothetical protein
MVKAEAETVAWDTVTVEDPELVRVIGEVCVCPLWRLRKLRLAGLDTRVPDPTAVPETGTLTTGSDASVVTATVPLEVPVDCGVKVTEKVFFCPGDRVVGKLRPVILKPRPLTVACFTVTLVLPEFTRDSDWVRLAPTLTLPRAKTVGEAVTCPATVPPVLLAEVPTPETKMLITVERVVNATSAGGSEPRRRLPLIVLPNLVLVVPTKETVA